MMIKLGMETCMLPTEKSCMPTEESSMPKIFDAMPIEDAYAKLDSSELPKVEVEVRRKAEAK